MSRIKTLTLKIRWRYRGLKYRLYVWRAWIRRQRRILFPSPAEVQFIILMGGRCRQIRWLKDPRTGFCFTRIKSLGTTLSKELVQREVRAGAMYIDFAVATKYYKKGIEIDGRAYHMDILREQQRDNYVAQYGYKLLHIQAIDLRLRPQIVQRRVLDFLQN
jgi:very-short-patch-repair endonuclease